MKRYIPVSRVEGTASRQAHCDLPEGTYEREMSKEGFFGPAAFFHHRHPPTGWTDFDGPLRPRAFDLSKLAVAGGHEPVVGQRGAGERTLPDPLLAPRCRHGASSRATQTATSCCSSTQAVATCIATSGTSRSRRATTWCCRAARCGASNCAAPLEALLIEATNSSYMLPDKGTGRPARDLRSGHARHAARSMPHSWRSRATRRPGRSRSSDATQVSLITYPFNPLDAVGWHGELSAVRINVRDIRPLMSHRYHLPPSAHTTFLSDRFVVCTFVPRPFETDPGALKVPFFHNNDDYDEVIFYHAGDFFSRDNIHPGMMTLHPGGFTHGPHPKALKRMFRQAKPATDEYAVMIDTRDPLDGDRGRSRRRMDGLRRQLEDR